MKLRLTPNSLRLRVTRSEVADIRQNGRLVCALQAGPAAGNVLAYGLEFVSTLPAIAIAFSQSRITVQVPAKLGEHWAQTGEVGLYGDTPWGLRVMVEKDFKCLDPRHAEVESDAYEHPAAQKGIVVKPKGLPAEASHA